MMGFFKIFIILLMFIPESYGLYSIPSKRAFYFKAKIGCLEPKSTYLNLKCTEQKLSFKILKTLHYSRRKNSNKNLKKLIEKRARHFLEKKEFDYFSVAALMVFPIKNKKKWLKRFASISGKKSSLVKVALARSRGKKSKFCRRQRKSRKIPFLLREICTIKVGPGRGPRV